MTSPTLVPCVASSLRRLVATACPHFCFFAFLFIHPACSQYRIEHHKRPAFFQKAAMGQLPDEVILDDGTIVKYSTTEEVSTLGRSGDGSKKPFEIREELPDGKIILRAVLPEHVLLHTLAAARNEEYELLYDQMLSDRTKERFEEAGQGEVEFADFFRKNRHELVASLTRMTTGLAHEETSITHLSDGVIRCRLRPQIAEPFKFRTLDVVKEGQGLKLLMIE